MWPGVPRSILRGKRRPCGTQHVHWFSISVNVSSLCGWLCFDLWRWGSLSRSSCSFVYTAQAGPRADQRRGIFQWMLSQITNLLWKISIHVAPVVQLHPYLSLREMSLVPSLDCSAGRCSRGRQGQRQWAPGCISAVQGPVPLSVAG